MSQVDSEVCPASSGGVHSQRRWLARSKSEPPIPAAWSLRSPGGHDLLTSDAPASGSTTNADRAPTDRFNSDDHGERGRADGRHEKWDGFAAGVNGSPPLFQSRPGPGDKDAPQPRPSTSMSFSKLDYPDTFASTPFRLANSKFPAASHTPGTLAFSVPYQFPHPQAYIMSMSIGTPGRLTPINRRVPAHLRAAASTMHLNTSFGKSDFMPTRSHTPAPMSDPDSSKRVSPSSKPFPDEQHGQFTDAVEAEDRPRQTGLSETAEPATASDLPRSSSSSQVTPASAEEAGFARPSQFQVSERASPEPARDLAEGDQAINDDSDCAAIITESAPAGKFNVEADRPIAEEIRPQAPFIEPEVAPETTVSGTGAEAIPPSTSVKAPIFTAEPEALVPPPQSDPTPPAPAIHPANPPPAVETRLRKSNTVSRSSLRASTSAVQDLSATEASLSGGSEPVTVRAVGPDGKKRRSKRSSLKHAFDSTAGSGAATAQVVGVGNGGDITSTPGRPHAAMPPLMAMVGPPRARSNTVNDPDPLALKKPRSTQTLSHSKPDDKVSSTSKPEAKKPRRPVTGAGAGDDTDGEPSWAWDELIRQLDAEDEERKRRHAHAAHRHGAGASNAQYPYGRGATNDMWWIAFEMAWEANMKKGKGIRTWWDLEKHWKPSDVFATTAGEDEGVADAPNEVKVEDGSKKAPANPINLDTKAGEKTLVSSPEGSPRHPDSRNSAKTLAANTNQSKRPGTGKPGHSAPAPLGSKAPEATTIPKHKDEDKARVQPDASAGHTTPTTPSRPSSHSSGISPIIDLPSSFPFPDTAAQQPKITSTKTGSTRRRYEPITLPKKAGSGEEDSDERKTTIREEIITRWEQGLKGSDIWKMWEEAEERWAAEDDNGDERDGGDAAKPTMPAARDRERDRSAAREGNRSKSKSRRASVSATGAAKAAPEREDASGAGGDVSDDRRGRNARPKLHIETDFTKAQALPRAQQNQQPEQQRSQSQQEPKAPKPVVGQRASTPPPERAHSQPHVQPEPQARPAPPPQQHRHSFAQQQRTRPQAPPHARTAPPPVILRAIPIPQGQAHTPDSPIAIAWRNYEAKWSSMLAPSSTERITFASVPWPVLRPPTAYSRSVLMVGADGKRHRVEVDEGSGLNALSTLAIAQFLLSPEHSVGIPARERFRRAIRRWHSDKFSRFAGRIKAEGTDGDPEADELERQHIMEGVGVVARALTQLLELERHD